MDSNCSYKSFLFALNLRSLSFIQLFCTIEGACYCIISDFFFFQFLPRKTCCAGFMVDLNCLIFLHMILVKHMKRRSPQEEGKQTIMKNSKNLCKAINMKQMSLSLFLIQENLVSYRER